MRNTFLFLLFLLISPLVYSQGIKSDSTKIESLFTSIISGKTNKDSSLLVLHKIYEKNLNNNSLIETYDFYFAKYLMLTGEMDSSIVISKKALKRIDADKNIAHQVKFLKLIASCSAYLQDYHKGIIFFKKALAICETTNNQEQAAYINNNIANLFFSLMDYESAYKYSSASFKYIEKHPDNSYYAGILAILSVAESKVNKNDEAFIHAREALKIATKTNNILALIVSNHALGDIEGERKNYGDAIHWFKASLKISDQYHQQHFSLLNHIGLLSCYIGTNQYEEAIDHGEKALELSLKTGNKNVSYSLKRKLAMAYHKTGQEKKAFEFMHEAHQIYKETTSLETQKAISDILIKYDSEKKEKEIEKNKVKIMKQEIESSRFRQIIITLSFALFILLILYYFIQLRNKSKLMSAKNLLEKETLRAIIEGEEKERERLAAELHDGISSTLTSICFKMENNDSKKNTELIQMIRDAQIDTRRISHNLSPLNIEKSGINLAMTQYASENSNSKTHIQFSNFCQNIQLNKDVERMIYRITQELVQNSIKHGESKQISIQFMCSNEQFNWTVEDDGKGFDVMKIKAGLGLLSIQKRIERIGGEFNIDSTKEGTIVQLAIPQ